MDNKIVIEKYKNGLLKYYNKMMESGYRGDLAFRPTVEKMKNYLHIKIPLKYSNDMDRRAHMNGKGVEFLYNNDDKSLLMSVGDFREGFDEKTGLPRVGEKLNLIYHSDGTMDINHFSEKNLLVTEKEEEDIDERTTKSMLSYGKNISAISFEELINESEILDDMDFDSFDFFDDLNKRLNFMAPEFKSSSLSKEDKEQLDER